MPILKNIHIDARDTENWRGVQYHVSAHTNYSTSVSLSGDASNSHTLLFMTPETAVKVAEALIACAKCVSEVSDGQG